MIVKTHANPSSKARRRRSWWERERIFFRCRRRGWNFFLRRFIVVSGTLNARKINWVRCSGELQDLFLFYKNSASTSLEEFHSSKSTSRKILDYFFLSAHSGWCEDKAISVLRVEGWTRDIPNRRALRQMLSYWRINHRMELSMNIIQCKLSLDWIIYRASSWLQCWIEARCGSQLLVES